MDYLKQLHMRVQNVEFMSNFPRFNFVEEIEENR